jgi:hypothetical protein
VVVGAGDGVDPGQVVGENGRQQRREEMFRVLGVDLGHDGAQLLHELEADLPAPARLADQPQPDGAVHPPSPVQPQQVLQERLVR